MESYIAQMLQDEEKLVRINKSRKQKNYNGNLVYLRRKRERLLIKKHNLNLAIKKYSKMSQEERDSIFNNIERLSIEIENINKEILKVQSGMQNSGQWYDELTI